MILVPRFGFRSSLLGLMLMVASGSAWVQGEELSRARAPEIAPGPAAPTAVPWQAATSYPEAVKRYGFAQNGEDLYVISGDTVGGGFTSALRRFNATTNIWTSLANIPSPSEGPVAAFYGGKIYVADGFSFGGAFRIYDTANNTWSVGPSRPGAFDSFGAAAGAFNGKVYVVGGTSGNVSNTLLSIYDIASNTWSVGPAAPSPFYLGGYAQNGRYLYLVGSLTTTSGVISTVTQRLDMATNTWTTGPAWPTPRGQCALAAAGTKIIAIGGDTNGGGGPSAQVDELDTSTWPGGTWVASPDNLPSPRTQFSAGFVSTGRVGGEIWSTGGEGPSNVVLNEHLFRAAPTCLDYAVSSSAGTIVLGTVDTGNHADDGSTVVALPFSYRLYDQEFGSVSVGSNGHLTFGTVNDNFNVTCIPITGATYAIGPYWTDQCAGTCSGVSGAGLGIFTSVSGSAPNRIFNIEWRTAYFNSGGAGVPLNYEVRLYEGQAVFDVIYGTVNTFNPQARNLSIGVQKNAAAGQFTLQGCDPTGGTAPPVSSGQLYHYVLTSTTCAPAPAPTGFLYALAEHTDSNNEVYGFSVDESSGALALLPGFPLSTGGVGALDTLFGRLAVDPVNQRLYAVNSGSKTVSAYHIDSSSGAIAPMPFSPINVGTAMYSVAVHPSGSPLLLNLSASVESFTVTSSTATLVNNYSAGSAAPLTSVFSRDGLYYYAGGSAVPSNSNPFVAGFSVNPATGGLTALAGSPFDTGVPLPLAYETDSQGRFYLAASTGQLRGFTTSSGVPSPVTGDPFVLGFSRGFHGLLHPNERFYFVASFSNVGIGAYRVSGSGAGTTLAAVAGSPFSSGSSSTSTLASNQSGSYLFAGNFNDGNLTTFNVGANSGVLTNLGVQPSQTLGASYVTGLAYTNASMVRSAVSRKTHGTAGVFDINLPLNGTPGVECRRGSGVGSGDHQIVISFASKVNVPSAGVSGIFTGGSFGVNGNVVTVDLQGVANAQTLAVILDNVTDGVNVGTVVIPMAVLLGDVNGDGFVLSGDYTAVRQKSGSAVDGNTFKFDINADGFILSGDYTTARQQSGAHLSPTKVGPVGKTSIKKLVTTVAERAKHY